MTSLGDLRAELFPAGRPIGSGATRGPSGDGPISWVRVMKARVPAFDALEPGDLALVPASALAVVAPTSADLDPLVGAFVAAPVAGVILVEGESLAPDPDVRLDELEQALVGAGLAGLRLPPADPAAVERSVIGHLVGRTAELERQAAILEADLARRALAGEGVEVILAAASAFLARPLALEGPRGDVLAAHAPAEAGAGLIAGGRIAPNAAVTRIALPSGGAIAVLGGPATDLDRVALARVAGLLALELARDEAVRRAADRRARAEPLPAGGPPWVVVLARQRALGPDDEAPAERSAREQLRRDVRLLAPARRLALRGDVDSFELRLVVGPPDETLVAQIGDRLARPIAVSRPFELAGERQAAEAEARTALEAALALPDAPRVARADRLAAYRLLGAMHNLAEGPRLARALLEPLLDARPDVRRERVHTLRAILERGGVNEAAAALGVHRNTVAYRLRSIERRTGWRLSDPDLRLPLAIAVQLVQEDQL